MEFFELNRLFVYLVAFGLYNVYYLYREFRAKQRQDLDLELLETSFRMEDMQAQQFQAIYGGMAQGSSNGSD